jgi:hypothetical protein
VNQFTDNCAAPEPQTRIRQNKQIDLVRCQFEALPPEQRQSIDPIKRKSDSEVFIREQSLDDDSNRVSCHGSHPLPDSMAALGTLVPTLPSSMTTSGNPFPGRHLTSLSSPWERTRTVRTVSAALSKRPDVHLPAPNPDHAILCPKNPEHPLAAPHDDHLHSGGSRRSPSCEQSHGNFGATSSSRGIPRLRWPISAPVVEHATVLSSRAH